MDRSVAEVEHGQALCPRVVKARACVLHPLNKVSESFVCYPGRDTNILKSVIFFMVSILKYLKRIFLVAPGIAQNSPSIFLLKTYNICSLPQVPINAQGDGERTREKGHKGLSPGLPSHLLVKLVKFSVPNIIAKQKERRQAQGKVDD